MWGFIVAVWQTLTACARKKIDEEIESVIEAHEINHPRAAPPVIINIVLTPPPERRNAHQWESHVGHKRHSTMHLTNT